MSKYKLALVEALADEAIALLDRAREVLHSVKNPSVEVFSMRQTLDKEVTRLRKELES